MDGEPLPLTGGDFPEDVEAVFVTSNAVRIDSLTFVIICTITHKVTLIRHCFARCRT